MFLPLLCFSCWMSVVHCKLLIVWNESYQWERYTGFSTSQRHNGHKWRSRDSWRRWAVPSLISCSASDSSQNIRNLLLTCWCDISQGTFRGSCLRGLEPIFFIFWCHTVCQQLVMFDFFSVQSSSFWGINSKDDRSYMVSSYVFFFKHFFSLALRRQDNDSKREDVKTK